jgi:hypothetical protein
MGRHKTTEAAGLFIVFIILFLETRHNECKIDNFANGIHFHPLPGQKCYKAF